MTGKKYSNIKEPHFAKFIDDKLATIINFVMQNNQIHSLLAIGSLGKRALRNYSNINLVLLTGEISQTILFTQFLELFSNDVFYSLQKKNKLLYYLNFKSGSIEKTFEVELLLVNEIQSLSELFKGSRFRRTDIDAIILVDKSDYISEYLTNLLKENEDYKENIGIVIQEKAKDFVEYFIQANFSLQKSDLYQYYRNMTKSYNELVSLEAIRQNNLEDLHNPIFGLARLMSDEEYL